MIEFHVKFAVPGGDCFAGHRARLRIKNCLNAVCAGDRFRNADYKPRKLHKLNQYLRHIIIKSNDISAGYASGIDAERSGIDEYGDGDVYENERRRIHDRGNSADRDLHIGERAILFAEIVYFLVLLAEGAHHSCSGEVFTGDAEKRVKLFLHLFIKRYAYEHNGKHDRRKKRNGDDEHKRRLHVNGKRHDDSAENDKRRAQDKTQREVYTCLYLVNVSGKPGEQRRRAERVKLQK